MKIKDKRGAILITTVILATGVALALGSFIALAVQSARLSNSSFHFNSALNLAEAGLEQAMVLINAKDFSAWPSRSLGGENALTKTFGPFDLGSGTQGYAEVAIFDAESAGPRVVAEGRTVGNLGSSVQKQIEIYLRRRSNFENGLVAKNRVTLVGNGVTVDSYDSEDLSKFPGGQFVEGGPKNDNGSVASAIVEETSDGVSIGNADVWGMVATSGSQVVYKPNGTVLGEDSFEKGFTKIDDDRITNDFIGEFTIEEPKPTSTVYYTSTAQFPTETYNGSSAYALGADGAASHYTVDLINLSGNEVLVLRGFVTLVVPTYYSSADSVSVTGNAQIVIAEGAQVTMYIEGNVKIAGNGISNPTGVPKDLIIHGTNDTVHQSIELGGNGQLKAAVNAPNAEVKLGGGGCNGSVCGSIVGYNITLNGGYPFHYDEALKNLGGDNPMRLGLWRELTSQADQVAF